MADFSLRLVGRKFCCAVSCATHGETEFCDCGRNPEV